MKLIRFGEPGREKPGVLLENGKRIDVTAAGIGDYDEAFFGGDGLSRLSAWLRGNAASAPEVSAATRLPPSWFRRARRRTPRAPPFWSRP